MDSVLAFINNNKLVISVTLLIIIILCVYYYTNLNDSKSTMILKDSRPLSTKIGLVAADVVKKKIVGTSGSTVMGFFKLQNGDRTSNATTPYIPIIQAENNWMLEIASAPQGLEHNLVRLRIKTIDAGALEDKIIDLPEIPKQRWVFIAILRDGRRFDIIYDNKIVASHRLETYPVVIAGVLSLGNTGLSGEANKIMIKEERLTPIDVESERQNYIDTNGVLKEDLTFIPSIPIIDLTNLCLPGLPCDYIKGPPSNNLVKWNSLFA